VSYKQCNKVSPVNSYSRVLHKHLHAGLSDKYTVTYKFKHSATLSSVVGCNQIFPSRLGLSQTVNVLQMFVQTLIPQKQVASHKEVESED
jgi:hypothetical protein